MLLNQEISLKEMVEKSNMDNFIYMEGQLPYAINISTNIYKFPLKIDLNGIYDNSNKSRKISFFTCQKWIEGQKIPSLKSVLKYNVLTGEYTNIVNYFKIMIEIFDDEISQLYIDNHNSKKEKKLFQAVLSYVSEKYNQSKMGNDYINMSIEDGGSTPIALYTKSENGYENKNIVILPALSIEKYSKHNELDFNEVLNKNDIVWLYYYNLAIYSYDRQDYLNTIIYSSISNEAYLNYLIVKNNLLDEFNNYNKELVENNQVPGFFSTTKFLLDNSIINKDLSKKMKKCYGILRDKRNDIIHGKIQEILINGIDSQKALEKLTEIYIQNEPDIIN